MVLAVEKIVTSKLYEPGTNKRIFQIDRHITAAVVGLLADARTIIERARDEAKDYRIQYGSPIPIEVFLLNLVNKPIIYFFIFSFSKIGSLCICTLTHYTALCDLLVVQ